MSAGKDSPPGNAQTTCAQSKVAEHHARESRGFASSSTAHIPRDAGKRVNYIKPQLLHL